MKDEEVDIDEILRVAGIYLRNAALLQAIDKYASAAEKMNLYEVTEKAERLKHEYLLMLDYFNSDATDYTRSEMLAQIYDKTYHLVDMIKNSEEEDKVYPKIADIDINDRKTLFDAIENLFPATKEDRNAIQQIILNEEYPLYLRGMVVSALTLNLLKYFDNELFESLYIYTLDDQPNAIRARALFGMYFIMVEHDDRIMTQPRIVEQIKLINEENRVSLGNREMSAFMFITLIIDKCLKAQETQRVIKKDIENKLYEGIMSMKQARDDVDETNFAPRWMEFMESSGLQEKLQEIAEKQNAGIDIMYGAFKKMYKIPFFNNKCNWFLPFDLNYPEFKPLMQRSKTRECFIRMLDNAINMCDTDKYGNAYMFAFIPTENLKCFEDQVKNENIEFNSVPKTTLIEELTHYSHDLYRYFTIFTDFDDFDDFPFDSSFSFTSIDILKEIITNPSDLRYIADFLMDSENYSGALKVLRSLIQIDMSEKNLQDKIYCDLNSGFFKMANLDELEKCNALYPGNKWTIKNYAKALHRHFLYFSEEKLLRENCEKYPKDTWFLAQLASCLMKQGRNEEALSLLYKADLINENSYKVVSTLAECAMNLKNKELAEKNICLALEFKKASVEDWLLGGIIAMWNGDIKLAISRFSNLSMQVLDDYTFNSTYFNDKVNHCGISKDDLSLVLEQARRIKMKKRKK